MSRHRIQANEEITRDWTQTHAPAANTQATCTQPAAGIGRRNVCTGLTVTLCSGSSAPAAGVAVTARLIDGASGATSYKWQGTFAIQAIAGALAGCVRENLWISGSVDTPMTLEWSAGPGAGAIQSVSMEGTTEVG